MKLSPPIRSRSFQSIYQALGLTFSGAAEEQIREHTAAQNPDRAAGKEKALRLNSSAVVNAWRDVLEPAEIDTIRARVAGVVEDFYPNSDW